MTGTNDPYIIKKLNAYLTKENSFIDLFIISNFRHF